MSSEGQLETIKVAEIYIKKGALDEAVEVLNEILSEDPTNTLARQKLKEIDASRAALAASKDAAALAAKESQKKAEQEARQQAEAADKKKIEDEVKKKSRRSSDDALSMMKSEDDELMEDVPARAQASEMASAPVPAPAALDSVKGIDPQLKERIASFLQSYAIETSLVIGDDGKLLDSAMVAENDALALAGTAANIFKNTEKAAGRMRFGGLQQVIVTSTDGRQIIFVRLKAAVFVAVTGKNTNLGVMRIAINGLMKKV